MSADRVAALAEVIWETSRRDEGTISATGANIIAKALLASPAMRDLLSEHEQMGREDNATHEMCYVSGSRALEALLAEERARALRSIVNELRVSGAYSEHRMADWVEMRIDRIARADREQP